MNKSRHNQSFDNLYRPNKHLEQKMKDNLNLLMKKNMMINHVQKSSLDHLPVFNKQIYTRNRPKHVYSNPIAMDIQEQPRRRISDFGNIIIKQNNYKF